MNTRLGVASVVMVFTILCGWTPARSGALMQADRALASIVLSGVPEIPAQPKPFDIPPQPIVAASPDGYLPSSWNVTPKGEFTMEVPLSVPPGRAGMAPGLSLSYASGTGNGLAGVGWSVTGFSTITRGGRVWARDGETDGVDYSVRDRFYLDGQELVGVNATPYGGDGAEYRTEPDTFVRVHSTSAQAQDPKGPEQFTVELGDGRARTYAAVEAEQIIFDDANQVFAHGPVRAEWRLVTEADASGNTITYEYQDTAGPGGANASDYWTESIPSKIFYTANLTNGQPTHGIQDLPQRYVAFEYEPRTDATTSWQAGVQRRHSLRLKTIRMYAPNPTATAEVWRYTLDYTVSGSQRGLLSAVQRCEATGGCLWAKQFTYSPATNGVLFQTQAIVSAPISAATNYDFTWPAAPEGEVPAMVLADLNGDGAADLVFAPGAGELWEKKYHPAFDAWLPDGNFLGGSHSLWLSQRDANGQLLPLSQGLSLARDEDPLASANYGHVRLDEATAVDVDGDGKDEMVAAIDNLGANEVNVDPNLPPLYLCSYAELKWTAAGFVHADAMPCTLLGYSDDYYKFFLPNEFPTFADLNGDGLPDRASPFNTGGFDFDDPEQAQQFQFAPTWKVAMNNSGNPGTFGSPLTDDQWPASPGVVTDLNGDGRAELTSETLKATLNFDDTYKWVSQTPGSVHLPPDDPADRAVGYREFGDYNGDGTEDVLLLTQSDPALPGSLTGRIYWNTGKGFYADNHEQTVSVDVHPDVFQKVATRFADPGIHVTDVNSDGRMDLVIFNNDHQAAGNQSSPQIEILISDGNGQFVEVDLPVGQPGTRDDVKYWLNGDLRPIKFYPGRLENDVTRYFVAAVGQIIPGLDNALLKAFPVEHYIERGGADETPGLAAGWNLATLADTNGDGLIDIVRHVGGNDPAGGFEVMQQAPQWGDELVAVKDEATVWPALSVEYSSEWSDRPEVNDSYQCTYPLSCPKSGLRVVRSVTSRLGLTDVAVGQDPLAMGHTWQYAYRDPVANQQGLGLFGFSEMRMWDDEPTHPVETITTYDLHTRDASGLYPGVGVPATVTVAQPILNPGAGQPASASARLTKTTYSYDVRPLNGGATHAVFPQSTHTSQWEEPVAIAWSGQGPDHLHVSGYAEPATPPVHVDTTFTVDDYGQATDTVTQTVKGIKTEVQTPRMNDTVNWQLGLVSERSVMTLESAKNAVPVWRTTDYTYTSRGQLETITTEPMSADPALQATTTLNYDDYGLLTGTTTTVAGEAPRTHHLAYANAWPGAPDEHLFASVAWAEHDNPQCSVDCRPASWMLVHPAYGLPVATMHVNGVQTVRTYDAHGRPITTNTDGELPVSIVYAGRPDTFGGMNGLQATATSGLQQVFKTFDARGATLRTSFGGFDGQWVNTFATYDLLSRPTAVSRPSGGAPTDWTMSAYDSLGRTVATTYPDGSVAKNEYHLLERRHHDPAGHERYENFDVDGRLVTSGTEVPQPDCQGLCLADNVETTYQYGATPTGRVTTVLDPEGHATTTHYDRRGRPVQQDDPSTGTTTVAYNGFGEAKTTVHVATGDTETETYDDLGRILTTTTPDGLTTFSWDVAVNGIGRLARAMSPDQIRTEYRYDSLGRTVGIDQTDETSATASVDFAYDAQTGHLSSIDYPKAPGQAARPRVGYAYNGYGYLTTVSDAPPNGTGTIWQQITARNADLALVDAVRGIDAGIGGGAIADHRDYDPLMGRLWTIAATHAGANRLSISYNYDADGLVNQRATTDEAVQIDETFEHDALHRLTHATRNGMPFNNGLPFSTSVDETYDTVGNRIDTSRNGQLIEHRSYGSNGQRPYTLTERDVADPANPNVPQAQKYQYDALGRLVQDPHRTLSWTAFDLPKSVTEDGNTFTFRHDAGHARVKKQGSGGTITYLAGLYEKHQTGQGTQHIYHIIGSDEAVADVTYTEAAQPTLPGTFDVRYPLTDALGSTNAIANAGGTVIEHDYYDAWGLRSNADGTPLKNLPLFQSLLGGGFTGQDHDDDLALVNMQGRLYDPALGRFLSADPIVGNPAFSESWNAYSYVGNSPLNFTDPSGLDPCPLGYVCTTGPGNEITNTIHTPAGNEKFGDDVIDVHAGAGALSDGMAWVRSSIELAKQQHEDDVKHGRALPDGTKIRAADGTPIPRRRINAQKGNRLEDNWGYPIRGAIIGPMGAKKGPAPTNTDGILTRRAADFAVRLACGSKCAEASAPTGARAAAAAPKQLSNMRIARNAVSQVLAARAVVKFLGKVGVIIDEGMDGIIDRLMPGMGMDDEERVMRMLAERRAERARLIAEAFEEYTAAESRHGAALSVLEKRLAQAAAAARDVDAIDGSTVGADLIRNVYSDALGEYQKAQNEVERTNRKAQVALDWLMALQADEDQWQ